MKEARIECLAVEYKLPDLLVGGKPLKLRKGEVVWVPEPDARGSMDLGHARKIGALSVEWRERCQVAKPKSPTPPWLSRKTTRPRRVAPTETSTETPTPAPQVDSEMVAKRAEKAASQAAREEMRKGLAEIKEMLMGQQQPGISQGQLEAALRNVLPTQPHTFTDGGITVTTDEPVFIPKDIVKSDADANINIKSEAAGGGSLDAAAEALKAAKPKTRRRKKDAAESADEEN